VTTDYGEYFNIAHIEPESYIYGPGSRFVAWFQGCALACKGCWNKEMWSFKNNQLLHKEQLLEHILAAPNIQGVTLLGGEPIHQADNLWWLMSQIRARSNLTLFLFTGYKIDELEALGHFSKIQEFCDMVAVGRFEENRRNINQQWIGSDNQQVIYPANSREVLKLKEVNQVEIIIDQNENITILGFPNEDLVKSLANT
jgi:anaerobic ribonucleoside-triphosphate reductase activating protein